MTYRPSFFTYPRGEVLTPGPVEPAPERKFLGRSIGDYAGCWDRKRMPNDTTSNAAWVGLKLRGNYVKGAVIDLQHKTTEPTGPEIKANNELDVAMENKSGIRADDSTYDMGIKARYQFGVETADWAMDLGGPRITGFRSLQSGQPFQMPHVHQPGFIDFHVAARERFALKYGMDPRLVDIAFEGVMTVFAEWYIQQIARQSATATVTYQGVTYNKEALAQANRDKLLAGGYTKELHETGFRRLLATCDLFEMPTSSALNPGQYLNTNEPGNPPVTSLPWTLAREAELEALLHERLCQGNNSMRADTTWPTGNVSAIYQEMWSHVRDSKGPKYYQTANTTLIQTNGGDLYMSCLKGVEMGAWMLELPGTEAQYTNTASWGMSPAEFNTINAGCRKNVKFDRIVIDSVEMMYCSGPAPTTYSEAMARRLAGVAVNPIDFQLGQGSTSARKITTKDTTLLGASAGTASHLVFVGLDKLLHVKAVTPREVFVAALLSVPSFTIEISEVA